MLEIFPVQASSFTEYGPMLRAGFELMIPVFEWSSTAQLYIASYNYSIKGNIVTSEFTVKTLSIYGSIALCWTLAALQFLDLLYSR
jgi:hypothetical protein